MQKVKRLLDKQNVYVVAPHGAGLVLLFEVLNLFGVSLLHFLNADVRGIPDHSVKTADPLKLTAPVKCIDSHLLLFGEKCHLFPIVEASFDKTVSTFDVVREVRQSPLMKHLELSIDGFFAFTFKHFQ